MAFRKSSKQTTTAPKAAPAKVAPAARPVASTPVRNTPVPKAAAAAPAARRQPTQSDIAARAYEIWQRSGGSQDENWFRAERELGL